MRAAGSLDILIAGYAIANDATVLAADHVAMGVELPQSPLRLLCDVVLCWNVVELRFNVKEKK